MERQNGHDRHIIENTMYGYDKEGQAKNEEDRVPDTRFKCSSGRQERQDNGGDAGTLEARK